MRRNRVLNIKTMPTVVGPEGLPSETEIAQSLAHLLPPILKEKFLCDRPLEIRPVEFHNPLKGHVAAPVRQVWIRANGTVPDDIRVHQYLLGYASDLNFLPSRFSLTASVFWKRAFRSPLSITLCGSIARSILMNGYFIAWRALPPPAPGALFAASFILRMARWSLQPCRKG